MDKCEHCPLKDAVADCFGGISKLCFYVDPNDKRYNQKYNHLFINKAGEFKAPEPLPVEKAAEAAPMPSIWQQVKNFTKSVVKHVAGGMKTVGEDVYQKRIATCEACPYLSKDRRCRLCGCPVGDKAAWASERCPDNPPRWDVDENPTGPERQRFGPVAPKTESPPKEKEGGCGCGKSR